MWVSARRRAHPHAAPARPAAAGCALYECRIHPIGILRRSVSYCPMPTRSTPTRSPAASLQLVDFVGTIPGPGFVVCDDDWHLPPSFVPQSVGNTCVGRNVDSRIGKASFVQLAFRRRALRAVCFGSTSFHDRTSLVCGTHYPNENKNQDHNIQFLVTFSNTIYGVFPVLATVLKF